MRIHLALALAFCAGTATAQTQMPISPFSSTFSTAALTRGFWFQAPVSFIITGLRVPDESAHGLQNVEVITMPTAPAPWPTLSTAQTQKFYATGVPSAQIISVSILINAGEFVGILGACGDASTMRNSYGAGPFTSDIMGNPVPITRFLTQTNLVASGGGQSYSTEPAGSIGRVEVYYTPPTGLYSNFSATPTSGASPLAVQFTDTTFTSDPGGVTSWAWDFENDGIVDSTIQNPSWTYNVCGYQDVSLTTTDTMFPASTEVKTAFITVDPQLLVTADFSATPTVVSTPGIVQFTDISVGSPTAWAWDLDGDSVVDSTLQNPSFTYNTVGLFDVTLTASNACGGHTVTKTAFINAVGGTANTASAEILEFQFNEVRGDQVFNSASTTLAPPFGTVDAAGWQADAGRLGFMGNEAGFGCLSANNVSPYNSRVDSNWPIDITGSHTVMFWHRVQTTPTFSYAFGGGSGSARCYYAGTYWSLRSWGNLPGFIDSGTDPKTLTGWNHWAVVVDDATGMGQWYLNGVADGAPLSFTPSSFTFQNAGNLIIGTYGNSTRYSRYVDTDDFRLYSSALTATEIQAALLQENPTSNLLDAGCPDAGGITPTISANSAPFIPSATYQIDLRNAEPGKAVAMVIGYTNHVGGGLPLPLTALGATCDLGAFPDILINFNTGPGTLSIPTPIPGGPWQAGFHIYTQFVILGTAGAVTPVLDTHLNQ